LPSGQAAHHVLQMFAEAILKNGVVRLIGWIDLQLIEPAAIVRLAYSRTLAPLVGDIGGDPEQIALRVLDRDLVAITQQPKKDFLREVIDFGTRYGRATGQPATQRFAPAPEPRTDAAVANMQIA